MTAWLLKYWKHAVFGDDLRHQCTNEDMGTLESILKWLHAVLYDDKWHCIWPTSPFNGAPYFHHHNGNEEHVMWVPLDARLMWHWTYCPACVCEVRMSVFGRWQCSSIWSLFLHPTWGRLSCPPGNVSTAIAASRFLLPFLCQAGWQLGLKWLGTLFWRHCYCVKGRLVVDIIDIFSARYNALQPSFHHWPI